MRLSQLVPITLVALSWASPALATAPTSENDLFRAITIQIPRRPDPPVCCLKPLTPLEPVEEEVFLSFEEWKAKQSVVQELARARGKDVSNRSANSVNGNRGSNTGNGSDAVTMAPDIPSSVDSLNLEETPFRSTESHSPHFRGPLTDRFNYASLDCSARVHASHSSAKSTSSILSSKRDRYMLSPCDSSKEKQFVVVELCEDITIDTVQLANFEFFSGVFKDFSVSVAKTYTSKSDEWTLAGIYKAKNVRGVQSFHPPTSLRDFYRFIRIDFLSHYSNEYYCPVSLLRVYGLTHLEQYKWDMWEAESIAKRDEPLKDEVQVPPEKIADVPVPVHVTSTDDIHTKQVPGDPTNGSSVTHVPEELAPTSQTSSHSRVEEIAHPSTIPLSHIATPDPPSDAIGNNIAVTSTDPTSTKTSVIHEPSNATHNNPTPSPYLSPISTATPTSSSSIQKSNTSSSPHHIQTTQSNTFSLSSVNSSTSRAASNAVTSTVITISPTLSHTSVSAVPPATTGGESIYRTIMNRLTALEANHTLYTRYVEQQTNGVREVLRRLGEDVGRLEGIARAQSLMYQRTMNDWEKRQQKLQMDYGELMARVEYLSDEIVLEKRLGIAQLCLLLAVLVFMGLTRGSRGEVLVEHTPAQLNKSMREWGKRHLSFSGDWTTRFRSKSVTERTDQTPPKPHPEAARPLPLNLSGDDNKVDFPIKESWRMEHTNIRPPLTPVDARSPLRRDSRSRTPSLRTRHYQRPVTPTSSSTLRPRLQRSNSQGGTHNTSGSVTAAMIPRSARRWARTAHLHEVRHGDAFSRRRGSARSEQRENVPPPDVFSAPVTWHGNREFGFSADLLDFNKGKSTRPYSPAACKTEDGDGDPWVDTDFEAELDQWEIKDPGRSVIFSGYEH